MSGADSEVGVDDMQELTLSTIRCAFADIGVERTLESGAALRVQGSPSSSTSTSTSTLMAGFDPLSWPHVVRSPSRVVHQVAREYHLKLMLADGSTSTVWVAYPKSADVDLKSGRRAAIRIRGEGEACPL